MDPSEMEVLGFAEVEAQTVPLHLQRSPRVKRLQRWQYRRLWSRLLLTRMTPCVTSTARSLVPSLHKQKYLPNCTSPFSVSQESQFVFSVYPTDPVVTIAYECFFFRVTVREIQAHALADTGASDKLYQRNVVQTAWCHTHQRKKPLQIRIADCSVRSCSQVVRLRTYISTLSARMAITVLESGIPLVFGNVILSSV